MRACTATHTHTLSFLRMLCHRGEDERWKSYWKNVISKFESGKGFRREVKPESPRGSTSNLREHVIRSFAESFRPPATSNVEGETSSSREGREVLTDAPPLPTRGSECQRLTTAATGQQI